MQCATLIAPYELARLSHEPSFAKRLLCGIEYWGLDVGFLVNRRYSPRHANDETLHKSLISNDLAKHEN